MEFIINTADGGLYYDLFYRLSFLVAFLIFLVEGFRRKYPLSTLLLVSVAVAIFAILGSKISAFNSEDWQFLLQNGALPNTQAKSSLGALLFGWLAIGLAQRWLRFKHSLLDVYVFAVPVALIFQRLGCLMAGCCFGHSTEASWGLSYGVFHQAWGHHYGASLIPYAADLSLPVHPVPIYFIISYLLTISLLIKFRGKVKASGSQALLGLWLLFGFRFFIEFFRNPVTNHGFGDMFLGLKWVQWILLGTVLLLGFLIYKKRKRTHYRSTRIPFKRPFISSY